MSHPTDPLLEYLAGWMEKNRITGRELGRRVGRSRNYVSGIFSQRNFSIIPFDTLDCVVKFPPDMLANVRAARKQFDHEKALRGGETLRQKTETISRKPWPVTVREMKSAPPVYARAWS